MNKLFIPPTLIAYCILSMILLYIIIPQFNLISFPYNMVGILIAFLGFVLMGKARDLFRKHKTTTRIEKSNHLIIDGVFSKTRNPMYLGMSILILGFSVLSTNVIALTLPIIFLILVSLIYIRKEERLLLKAFGEEYIKYKKNVRRWL